MLVQSFLCMESKITLLIFWVWRQNKAIRATVLWDCSHNTQFSRTSSGGKHKKIKIPPDIQLHIKGLNLTEMYVLYVRIAI